MAQKAAAVVLFVALGATAAVSVANAPADPPIGRTPTVYRTVTEHARYRGHSAAYWHMRLGQRTRALNARTKALTLSRSKLRSVTASVHRRWAPTVTYAIRLASAVYGVSESKMRAVAYCESTLNPFASNGRYRGLFQLGWSPFGFSAYDPVASALSTAQTVSRDGSWRQWTCG